MADILDLVMVAESQIVSTVRNPGERGGRERGRKRYDGVVSKHISFFLAFYSMQDPRLRDVNAHLRI